MIDLHCHSHFSDGLLSPEELIQRAIKEGLGCLSLTDHDTLEGYSALDEASYRSQIKIIKGIELSVRWKKYDLHILGYKLNPTPNFMNLIRKQSENRIARAVAIGDALALVGIENAYNKACDLAGSAEIGRPHFARVLLQEGKVKDMQSAFKKFLVRGKVAYVASNWVNLQEAVSEIVQSEGIAVIAHPLKYGLTRSKLHELIKEFKEVGGEGIEVISGEMTKTQIQEMAGISTRFNLLASSGSDFHGDSFSRTKLGKQQQLPAFCKPIWHDWNIE